jgi:hypothetical protein
LAIVTHPLTKESRKHWDRLDSSQRQAVKKVEERAALFESENLATADQLPELGGDDLVFEWDIQDKKTDSGEVKTVIRFEGKTVWKEPAFYEGYRRYGEVAEILKAKYGRRLRDLVPTDESKLYLYGDSSYAPESVAQCRQELRKDCRD